MKVTEGNVFLLVFYLRNNLLKCGRISLSKLETNKKINIDITLNLDLTQCVNLNLVNLHCISFSQFTISKYLPKRKAVELNKLAFRRPI